MLPAALLHQAFLTPTGVLVPAWEQALAALTPPPTAGLVQSPLVDGHRYLLWPWFLYLQTVTQTPMPLQSPLVDGQRTLTAPWQQFFAREF